MFDHVVFGVSDYEESKAFFIKALAPLGITIFYEGELGIELGLAGEKTSLCIRRNGEKTTPLHLAFSAANRQQVIDFHAAAMLAGAKDNGGPGFRPEYNANYYAAFVIGPDGHNIEAVCHEPS